MKAIEEWLTKNGAEYVYIVTEEDNVASKNMFTLKCDYRLWSSLHIYVLPIEKHIMQFSENIHTEKLSVNQAFSFYKSQLKCKNFYPVDVETILRGNPSLGTWVCYFNDDGSEDVHIKDRNTDTTKLSSWIVFSLWNSREVCCGSLQKPSGFLFMYGLFGEGKKVRDLMKASWNFAAKFGEDENCKLVITEIGDSDPLKNHIPLESSMLCIKDVWYLKNVTENLGVNNEERTIALSGDLGNVFVDPRDF